MQGVTAFLFRTSHQGSPRFELIKIGLSKKDKS